MGPTGGRSHERRQAGGGVGGFGGPAVLLGRAVVQSVVGLGQRGPACLVNIQRAHGLIPQAHRAGRGTERSGRKGRRRASGASHLSHAAHATVKNKTKQPPPRPPAPKTTNKQAETTTRREESQTERKKIRKSNRKSLLGSIRVSLQNKKLKICLYLNFCIEGNGKRLNVKAEEK